MFTSIVIPTARFGGIDIIDQCLSQQTYKNFEVIIADELHRGYLHLRELPRFDGVNKLVKFINPPPKKKGAYWNLDGSMNAAIRIARGDMIVSIQDYIWVPPQGIHKFINRMHEEWPCLITGVGHQYKFPEKPDNLKGDYSIWNQFPGEPSGELVFSDPRLKDKRKGFYLCNPVEWELNWCCFPRKVWETIGGFDEDFDASWGYDNVNFAERAQLAGFNIFIDTDNEIKAYNHIGLFKEQKMRDAAPNGQELWHRKYRGMHKLGETWKLNYA